MDPATLSLVVSLIDVAAHAVLKLVVETMLQIEPELHSESPYVGCTIHYGVATVVLIFIQPAQCIPTSSFDVDTCMRHINVGKVNNSRAYPFTSSRRRVPRQGPGFPSLCSLITPST